MPLATLACYAQRVGAVFASVTTWARLARERQWRGPRDRVHPAKPVSVRARRPNEIWHLDVTILKLLDGTRAYVHAVIDNFSRKILACTVEARLDPTTTGNLLLAAGKHLVDATVPMIEAFWRSLKHGRLYLNRLESIGRVRELVAFHVDAHNAEMPHSTFDGQTPDEVFFRLGTSLPADLAEARREAYAARLAANRPEWVQGGVGRAVSRERPPPKLVRFGSRDAVIRRPSVVDSQARRGSPLQFNARICVAL
jgi:transposase InsO family protein